MSHLVSILALLLLGYLFWQQRRQSELAKMIIAKKCEQLDLQLLSVAFSAHKLKTPDGVWRWHTLYQFEFSSLGDDRYHGELQMSGFKAIGIHLPPHRL